MSTLTDEDDIDLTYPGFGTVWVRPMFELLTDFGDLSFSHDAAQWPEPFPFHDLELEDM